LAGYPVADAKLLAMAPAFEALYQQWIDHTIAERMSLREFDAELERRTGVARADRPYPIEDDHPFWITYHEISDVRHADDPEEDEDGNPPRTFMDDLHDMAHEILWNHWPTTRAGLRLQVLAVTSSWSEAWEGIEWDTGPAQFIASMAAFCDVPFPPYEEDEDEGRADRPDPIFAAIGWHRKAEEEFASIMNYTDTVWYQQQVEAGLAEGLPFRPGPEADAEYARLSNRADDAAVRLIRHQNHDNGRRKGVAGLRV
jgi:hypothetical protein